MDRDIRKFESDFEVADLKAKALKRELKAAEKQQKEYKHEREAERGRRPYTLFPEAERAELLRRHKEKLAEDAARLAQEAASDKPKNDPSAAGTVLTGWFPEDLYNQYPIERWTEYGLTAADVENLKTLKLKSGEQFGPIETVGRMAEFSTPTASGWQRSLTDAKGIGPAGMQRVETAGMKFWAAWRNGLAEKFAVEMGYSKDGATPAGPPKAPEKAKNADGKKSTGKRAGKSGVAGKKGRPVAKGGGQHAAPEPADAPAESADTGYTVPSGGQGEPAEEVKDYSYNFRVGDLE
jgi:hypothetical protein